jgi:beta-lactamase class A
MPSRMRSSRARRRPTRDSITTPPSSLGVLEDSLYARVQQVKEAHHLERLGIAFYDAQTTLQWSYNAESYFHAASTIKLAVLVTLYGEVAKGRLTEDAPVHVRNRFASLVGGEPFTVELGSAAEEQVAKHLGRTMSVRDLAYEMITRSSNFATNLLIDVVGVPTIQQSLEELRVDGVILLRGVLDQAAYDAGQNNEVTANGVLKLLRLIAEGRAWSPEVCAPMLEILLDQRYKSGIPAGLPGDAQVAHKTGNISTVSHDAGIVFIGNRRPYFLVVLTQFEPGAKKASAALAEISRDIYETMCRIER